MKRDYVENTRMNYTLTTNSTECVRKTLYIDTYHLIKKVNYLLQKLKTTKKIITQDIKRK